MIVLDTNVTSELMRAQPDPAVTQWLAAQPPTELFSTVISVAEIGYGLERLPRGRRRTSLEQSFQALFVPMEAQIACIAARRRAVIATRNERDFADCGVRLVNPWRHPD